MNKRFLAVLLVVVPVLMLSACEKKAPPELTQKASNIPASTAKGVLETENVFIAVAKQVTPAVVNIRSYQSVEEGESSSYDLGGQMPEDQFHGGGKGKPHKEQSVGSGVIISADGYIITNAHVVEGSDDTTVKLLDKREFTAKLVGEDPKTDIAVLKIEGKGDLPVANLGDSTNLEIGQWAIAIGNPFGLERTVTVGVISGVGRDDVGVTQYENFIQTDASINPGNSGGPLLNSRGEVIGINTAIMSAGQGISFAIPVNMAKDIAKTLIEKGKVVRGWLGVGIQTLTPEVAEGLGIRTKTGVLVNKVYSGSPAASAGLQVGDVIVSYGGKPVSESRQLQGIVAGTKVGSSMDVRAVRDGREKAFRVRITEMDAFEGRDNKLKKTEPDSTELLGLTVHAVGSEAVEALGHKGVVVVDVDGGSAAEKAGMMPGDLVIGIGRDKVDGVNDFKRAAGRLKNGDMATFLVVRARNPLYVAFRVKP